MKTRIYAITLVLGGIFVGACVAPQLSPQPSTAETPTTPKPIVWEYKVVETPKYLEAYEKALNAEGGMEWELVSHQAGIFIFKKPKV